MTPPALLLLLLALMLTSCAISGAPRSQPAPDEADPETRPGMTDDQVTQFAKVALGCVTREYPNKPGNVVSGPEDVLSPREMHPAFYGCFDWHSAVHGHWTLVRLLKLHPGWTAKRAEVIAAVGGNLTAEKLRKETAYFDAQSNQSFERTYGWAWLLQLAQELRTWDDELGRTWAANLKPLEDRIVALTKAYLPKLTIPVRSGEHRDTAFGLAFMLDYARAVKDTELEALCVERATTYYGKDADYPVRYEPSGHDFFSAGLNVADLMRRVLSSTEYRTWLDGFLPGLANRKLEGIATPASVSDVTDGKLVHLAGLNLTRAWTMHGIASDLPKGDARRAYLRVLAKAHQEAGLGYVFSGDYAGEHWLGSFAVYLLTSARR